MPSELETEENKPGLRIVISSLFDFQFGLFLLAKHRVQPEQWVPAWVHEADREGKALVDELMAFWVEPGLLEINGEPYREWGEFLVAAWHTGSFFNAQVDASLDAIEQAFERGFPIPALPSEPEAVHDLIARRVRWLYENPGGRARFIEILRSLWKMIEPVWQSIGKPGAERSAREMAVRAVSGIEIATLVPANGYCVRDAFRASIDSARQRNELVIVPLGLAGGGQSFWTFPNLVYIGTGVDSTERLTKRREIAERAANKLKALSDPTRVAILAELLRQKPDAASTITELAARFGVSQPTVSVHIKMLREAGLAVPRRDGNQTFYTAEQSVLRAYVAGALDDILDVKA